MFGEGSKKPPAVPWALQILTTDYLAAGIVPPSEYSIGGENVFYEACHNHGRDAFGLLAMGSVQLEATGGLSVAPETLPNWTLGLCDTLVAIIPNDESNRQAAQQAYHDYHDPLPIVFYAGPYLVAGSYLADPSSHTMLFRDEKSLRPMADATIDCLLPGSRLKGWRVPWLLLSGRRVHGYRWL